MQITRFARARIEEVKYTTRFAKEGAAEVTKLHDLLKQASQK